ncbi:MAG: DUF3822 family protein [Bacteroidota bacterium]|nr:DUF3822 family protein [Bacteroidota bacterium]
MQPIEIIDKNLQNTGFKNCAMSVLTGPDGCCFSIQDKKENKFMAFRSFHATSEPSAKETDKNKKAFLTDIWGKDVAIPVQHVVYYSRDVLMLPNAFVEGEKLNDVMQFHYPNVVDKSLVLSEFPNQEYKLAGLVDEPMHKSLTDILRPASVELSAAALVKSALKYNNPKQPDAVFVQVWDSFAEMLVFSNGSPRLFNVYNWKKSNDLVYYVLNLFKQLVLDPKTCPVMFSGWIEKNDLALIQLNKFIKHIYLETLNPDKSYSYQFQDTRPHYFVNFLNFD